MMTRTSAPVLALLACLAVFAAPSVARAQAGHTLCHVISAYKTPSGAAYQPGVDVHGRPVVPADVNVPMSSTLVGDVVKIPLTIDLARRMNLTLPEGSEFKPVLGNIEVRRDGSVTFEGRDITGNVPILCNTPAQPETESAAAVSAPVAPSAAPRAGLPDGTVLDPPKVLGQITVPPGAAPAAVPPAQVQAPASTENMPVPAPALPEGPDGEDDIIWGQGS